MLTDVHGAQSVGMSGILVKTGIALNFHTYTNVFTQCKDTLKHTHTHTAGKYLNGDEESINPPPSAVCDDFSSAVKLIKNSLVTISEQFNTKHN